MKQAKSLILAAAASVLLATAVPCAALAAHLTGDSKWSATYNSSGRMEETYNAQEYVDQVSNLQPGDDITFDSQKTHKWVLSGYEDGGQTVFYMCEMAADDDFAIYSVEFNYPAANAKTCDPIVGDFMKNFTYDR